MSYITPQLSQEEGLGLAAPLERTIVGYSLPPPFAQSLLHQHNQRTVDAPDSLFVGSSAAFTADLAYGGIGKLLRHEQTGPKGEREEWGIYRSQDCNEPETRLTRQGFAVECSGMTWIDVVVVEEQEGRKEESGGQGKGDLEAAASRETAGTQEEERSDTDSGFRDPDPAVAVAASSSSTEAAPAPAPFTYSGIAFNPASSSLTQPLSTPSGSPHFNLDFRAASDVHFRQLLSGFAKLFESIPQHRLEITDLIISESSIRHELALLTSTSIGPTRRSSALSVIKDSLAPGNKSLLLENLHVHAQVDRGEKVTLIVESPVVVFSEVQIEYDGRAPKMAVWKVSVFTDRDSVERAWMCL